MAVILGISTNERGTPGKVLQRYWLKLKDTYCGIHVPQLKNIPKETVVVLVAFCSISNIYNELGAVVQEWDY